MPHSPRPRIARRHQLAARLRDLARTNRAAARIHRRGNGSLATHVIATGIGPREARSVAGTLRKKAAELGITGVEARVHAGRRMRTTHRYTIAEVGVIAAAYRPRKPAYKLAAARMTRAAMATAA